MDWRHVEAVLNEGLAWLLGALATWRMTHLLWAEDGPGGVVSSLRALALRSGVGAVFDCFYCLSLWVALPLTLALLWQQSALWSLYLPIGWLGLSGAAIVIERFNPQGSTRAHDEKETPP